MKQENADLQAKLDKYRGYTAADLQAISKQTIEEADKEQLYRWCLMLIGKLTTLEAAVGRLPKLEGKVMISPFRNDVVVLEFAGGMPELADCYTKELADALASLLRLRQEAP